MKNIIFQDWGTLSYKDAWEKQESILQSTIDEKLMQKDTKNHLIFVEHPHVYTLGKSGNEQNLLVNAIQLQDKQAQFVKVNRGGDITYHGPGQIVVYPILDLTNFNLGIKEYVHTLEEVVIKTIADYNIKGERLDGATGVWIDTHTRHARKICAIGIKCSRYITMHGFALNVNTNLDYFGYINPCGFTDKGVTSIAKEKGNDIDVNEVKKTIKKHFAELFGSTLI